MRLDPQGHGLDVPFEVLRRFVERVGSEIRASRAWMRLRPDPVEAVHRLRRDHPGAVGAVGDADVLARLRETVAAADLPVVLAAAFGRGHDGAGLDGGRALRIAEEAAAG
ncbi:hypothetical protein ACIRD3_11230 [Kitasatospora sp. NPDC093550]|uniref:hypothetical protein n=1 Tax=Kitasatospora sp. NPDC093550 TaxID=3364089 RepID=UPI0038090B39